MANTAGDSTNNGPFNKPAVFSPDGKLRYALVRHWGKGEGEHETLNFIMCNPSTADDVNNDQTIRRCVDFAQRWGYHRLIVTNVSPFRSRWPSDLQSAVLSSQEWATNDRYIQEAADASALVVVSWGSDAPRGMVARALGVLDDIPLHCLGLNAHCSPTHPLQAPGTQLPEPYHSAGRYWVYVRPHNEVMVHYGRCRVFRRDEDRRIKLLEDWLGGACGFGTLEDAIASALAKTGREPAYCMHPECIGPALDNR